MWSSLNDPAFSKMKSILGLSSTLCNSFPCCLSILFLVFFCLFFYDPFVPMVCSEIVLFPLHPVSRLSTHFLPLLADRNFFLCFGKSCFACIVWSCLGIFSGFLLSPVPSDLSLRVVSFVVVLLLFPLSPKILYFFFLFIFGCRRILIRVSNLISLLVLAILFLFFRSNPTFSLTNFAPA